MLGGPGAATTAQLNILCAAHAKGDRIKAHVEWIIGVLRAGPEFKDFGDPYEFSCSVIRRGDSCEIVGASGKLTMPIYRAIRETLEAEGIKVATWERSSGKQVAAKRKE